MQMLVQYMLLTIYSLEWTPKKRWHTSRNKGRIFIANSVLLSFTPSSSNVWGNVVSTSPTVCANILYRGSRMNSTKLRGASTTEGFRENVLLQNICRRKVNKYTIIIIVYGLGAPIFGTGIRGNYVCAYCLLLVILCTSLYRSTDHPKVFLQNAERKIVLKETKICKYARQSENTTVEWSGCIFES